MGLSQVEGPSTVTVDGVAVEKRVETEAFPRPAVVFDLRSTRDEPVSVRLVDPVPDDVDVDDLGFHADHGDEHWSKAGSTLVFEHVLPVGEEYSTLYAIHDEEAPLDSFMAEPDVEVSEPEEVVAERTTRVERPANDDAEESSDWRTVERESAGETSVERADAASRDGSATAGEGDSGDAEPEPTSTASPASSEGVVDELLRELREGSVDEEKRAALRSELQPSEGSLDARLDRVQSDVADLRAYTDAIETFLDENGGGQQLVEDLDADIDRVESDLAALDARVGTNEDELESVNYSVAEMDREMDELAEETAAVEDSLSTLRADLESLSEAVPEEDLADRLDAVETQLESVRSWQDHVKAAFGRSFDTDRFDGGSGETG